MPIQFTNPHPLHFDQGKIVAGFHMLLLCEVELELKEGSPAAVFAFARALDALAPLQLSPVRHQHQLDRMHDLNNGGFLAHRSRMENEDETEIRNTSAVFRAGCEKHQTGDTEAVFGRRKDQDRA